MRRRAALFVVLLGIAPWIGCKSAPDSGGSDQQTAATRTDPQEHAVLAVTSGAFAADAAIPAVYTCDGEDTSPPLAWSGLPESTQSVVLIVDDPDAPDPADPKMTWVHWVLYDLPASAGGLSEGADKSGLPDGTRRGTNDWKRADYGGPCPPIGRHRYFHKVYALDVTLGDLGQPTKAAVEAAMEGHIVGQGELVGTYEKQTSTE